MRTSQDRRALLVAALAPLLLSLGCDDGGDGPSFGAATDAADSPDIATPDTRGDARSTTAPDTAHATGDPDTAHATGDPDTAVTPGTDAPVGAACEADRDCAGPDPRCLREGFEGGYCVVTGCGEGGHPCPSGSTCYSFGDDAPAMCIQDCASDADCRGGEGYECDSYDTCWPAGDGGGGPSEGEIGAACEADAECAGETGACLDTMPGGYCVVTQCGSQGVECPAGSTCFSFGEGNPNMCIQDCGGDGDCRGDEGYVCDADATCWPGDPVSEPCTADSCAEGYDCAESGQCVPNLSGGPGPGPGPTCDQIPPRDCDAGASACAALTQFTPETGPGYENYPLNGETWANQYRSFAREDMQMLIKWATATVDCKAAGWSGGHGDPLGLGDMSEEDGAIPGTSVGQPGHPEGTHLDGYDMDIAYYQVDTTDNRLRPVCDHRQGGQDQYRCVAPPDRLDVWRSAYFIGLLFASPRVRVIGVDGQIGPLIEGAIDRLCDDGWLGGSSCGPIALAYETTDEGYGWYRFHHHHLHLSLDGAPASGPTLATRPCKVPGCPPVDEGAHRGCQVTPARPDKGDPTVPEGRDRR